MAFTLLAYLHFSVVYAQRLHADMSAQVRTTALENDV